MIRDLASAIIGQSIPERGWQTTFHRLDVQGKFTMRLVIDLLGVLFMYIEKKESEIASLQESVAELEEKVLLANEPKPTKRKSDRGV